MVLLIKIPTIVTPAAPLPIAAKSLPAQVKSLKIYILEFALIHN